MSAPMVGSDVDQLDILAGRIDQDAVAVEALSRVMGATVKAAPWIGAVADTFRIRWSSVHARRLAECADFLRDGARELRRNAEEQRQASGARGFFRAKQATSAQLVTAAQLIVGLETAGDVVSVRKYWESLTPSQREALIAARPDLVGNLDGIPPEDRFRANRLQAERDLQALIDSGQTSGKKYELLKYLVEGTSIDASGRSTGQPVQIYLYDPSGDGRVAVVYGDLESANNIAVSVPGTGSGFDSALGDFGNARNLFNKSGSGTAVVAWIGYDAPDAVYPTHNGQPLNDFLGDNAVLTKFADSGKDQLANSLAGLGVPREKHMTVIGHSYGSIVAAQGAHSYGQVDDLILIGSPGVRFANASDIQVDGHVYAMGAPSDPVAMLPVFGPTPTDPHFGAEILDASAPEYQRAKWYNPIEMHSSYFDPNSNALDNMAKIISDPDPRNLQYSSRSSGLSSPTSTVIGTPNIRDISHGLSDVISYWTRFR